MCIGLHDVNSRSRVSALLFRFGTKTRCCSNMITINKYIYEHFWIISVEVVYRHYYTEFFIVWLCLILTRGYLSPKSLNNVSLFRMICSPNIRFWTSWLLSYKWAFKSEFIINERWRKTTLQRSDALGKSQNQCVFYSRFA